MGDAITSPFRELSLGEGCWAVYTRVPLGKGSSWEAPPKSALCQGTALLATWPATPPVLGDTVLCGQEEAAVRWLRRGGGAGPSQGSGLDAEPLVSHS